MLNKNLPENLHLPKNTETMAPTTNSFSDTDDKLGCLILISQWHTKNVGVSISSLQLKKIFGNNYINVRDNSRFFAKTRKTRRFNYNKEDNFTFCYEINVKEYNRWRSERKIGDTLDKKTMIDVLVKLAHLYKKPESVMLQTTFTFEGADITIAFPHKRRANGMLDLQAPISTKMCKELMSHLGYVDISNQVPTTALHWLQTQQNKTPEMLEMIDILVQQTSDRKGYLASQGMTKLDFLGALNRSPNQVIYIQPPQSPIFALPDSVRIPTLMSTIRKQLKLTKKKLSNIWLAPCATFQELLSELGFKPVIMRSDGAYVEQTNAEMLKLLEQKMFERTGIKFSIVDK